MCYRILIKMFKTYIVDKLKKNLMAKLILILILASTSLANCQENQSLPDTEGYCGICLDGAFVGSKCNCTFSQEEWKKAGYDYGRCVRNIKDLNSLNFLCRVDLPLQ